MPSRTNEEKFDIVLGETLRAAGILTLHQLQQAMYEMPESGFSLGEYCLEQDWVEVEKLYGYISTERLRLGEIFLLHGDITLDKLLQILKDKRANPGSKVGDLLVKRGWITPEQVDWALSEQAALRELADPHAWPTLQARWHGPAESPAPAASEKPLVLSSPDAASPALPDSSPPDGSQLDTPTPSPDTAPIVPSTPETQPQSSQDPSQTESPDETVPPEPADLQQKVQWLRERIQSLEEHNQELETLAQENQALLQQLQEARSIEKTHQVMIQELTQSLEETQARVIQLEEELQQKTNYELELYRDVQAELSQLDLSQLSNGQALAAPITDPIPPPSAGEFPVPANTIWQLQQELMEKQRLQTEQQDELSILKAQLAYERVEKAELVQQLKRLQYTQAATDRPAAEAFSTHPGVYSGQTAELPLPPQPTGSSHPTPDQPEHLDSPELNTLDVFAQANPWAQRILSNLFAADLVPVESIKRILLEWEQSAGTLTEVLGRISGLSAQTVTFFSEGGYSARLAGAQDLSDYLVASGIVSPEHIQAAKQAEASSVSTWLVEQGHLSQKTADYFERTFGLGQQSQAFPSTAMS